MTIFITHSWRHVHWQFSTTGEGSKLMRWQRRWSFHHSDAVLHRLLHLLEGTHAYLVHALARYAELVRELIERDRLFGESARLEDAPLPVVERGDRQGEGLTAAVELLACGECRLLVGTLVNQPVLPLAGITVLADRSVERYIAPKASVHVDHVLLGDADAPGDELDLVGAQVALFQGGDLALGLTKIEEEFLLVGGGAIFTRDHERRI